MSLEKKKKLLLFKVGLIVKFLWPDLNIKAEQLVSFLFVEIYLLIKNENYHATLFRCIDN